jgi:hypothetical protein
MGSKGNDGTSEIVGSPSGNTFHVNRPSDWLVFKFCYERPHTWRSLSLRDPEGKIRLSHLDCYNSRTAVIGRNPERSSYLAVPGLIPAGEWKIEFAERWESEARTFTFEWEAGYGDLPFDIDIPSGERNFWTDTASGQNHYELNLYDWLECREYSSRWYKGDFHTHTVLSDGKMTPEQNLEQAYRMGLDFFVVTDHNLLSTSWPKGRTLVIPGIEITSEYGHWNALGLRQWIDWRSCSSDGGMDTQQGMNRLMEEAEQQGALRSINHPMLAPWAWVHEDTPLALVDCMEIWNDPTYHSNPAATEKALVLWSVLWNEGCSVTGIGGSDSHLLPSESYRENGPPSVIGDPATYVYADGLSAAAVLEAVRKGRVYVSRGPVLDISVEVDGKTYPLGSDLTEAVNASPPDGTMSCTITLSNGTEGKIHAIQNGKEVSVHEIAEDGRIYEFTFDWREAGYVWMRFELRSPSGELLAFTNPVFSGAKKPAIVTWKQLLDKASFEVPDNKAE